MDANSIFQGQCRGCRHSRIVTSLSTLQNHNICVLDQGSVISLKMLLPHKVLSIPSLTCKSCGWGDGEGLGSGLGSSSPAPCADEVITCF